MPDKMAPMACSRIPKCRVRPYQWAVYSLVEIDGGPKESTPFMVVLLLPAKSAEPPHNSGSFGPTADSTAPDAARVANALDPGSQCGMSAPSHRATAARSTGPTALCARVRVAPTPRTPVAS